MNDQTKTFSDAVIVTTNASHGADRPNHMPFANICNDPTNIAMGHRIGNPLGIEELRVGIVISSIITCLGRISFRKQFA
jgi:hypothetical protein